MITKEDQWFTYKKFYEDIVNKNPNYTKFVEIGVWAGASISHLAKVLKESKRQCEIIAVDVWNAGYVPYYDTNDIRERLGGGDIYDIYNENLQHYDIRDMITDDRTISWDAADNYEDDYFDFIYIDAGHNYEDVCKDIDAWMPKLKVGGIISGHDYWLDMTNPGVVKAVDEKIDELNILPEQGVWWTKKMK